MSIREASVIVNPHGSAFTNLLWCTPGTYIIELFTGEYTPPHYYYISHVLGLNYSYIVDGSSKHKRHGSGTKNISSDMTVDVEVLNRELTKILG